MTLLLTGTKKKSMKVQLRKLARWLDRLKQRRPPVAEIRLRVSNITRQTLLAEFLEVADYGPRRRKGLLGRERLAPGEGLWIIPCEAVHTFGMRFPIDLVYLDRRHLILKIRSHVRPGRLSACLSAQSVIELPSGTVRNTQTMCGDTLEFVSDPLPETRDYEPPAKEHP
jgi:uncharacterized membrane protein (UPF0127 family)